jgi:hypothetical protein
VDKLYLIVRADLAPGLQAAQLVHAMRQWVEEYPRDDRKWFDNSNTVALLALPNEAALGVLLGQAQRFGIPAAAFREPDLDNQLTALALGPQAKRLTRNIPPAFRKNDRIPGPTVQTSDS